MRTSIIFILLLLLFSASVYSQKSGSPFKNSIFVEGGGHGPYYSVNYERLVVETMNMTFNIRIGAAYVPNRISFPVAVSAYTTGGTHHLQLSLGGTPLIESKANGTSDTFLYLVSGIGYRYQRTSNKPFFGLTLNPTLQLDPTSSTVSEETKFIFSGGVFGGFRF